MDELVVKFLDLSAGMDDFSVMSALVVIGPATRLRAGFPGRGVNLLKSRDGAEQSLTSTRFFGQGALPTVVGPYPSP